MKKIIVAIDGYSSSGKSTMARELAKKVGYIYVDSGAMYRAVTLYALEHEMVADGEVDRDRLIGSLPEIHIGFMPKGEDGVQHTILNGRDVEDGIRGMRVSEVVSKVAEIAEVREHLVSLQQSFGEEKGIVMDGRDIGTTVFPDAEMKVFVEASSEVRAERRLKELEAKGVSVNYEDVLNNIKTRDQIDTTRAVSPLCKAADAHVLDNDHLTRQEQMAWLINLFHVISNE